MCVSALLTTSSTGLCGISSARFSASGNEVLTSAEFELRLTIWALTDERSPRYIDRPKFGCEQGLAFSEDGKYMAVVHRDKHKDYVAVYLCEQWQLATVRPFVSLYLTLKHTLL